MASSLERLHTPILEEENPGRSRKQQKEEFVRCVFLLKKLYPFRYVQFALNVTKKKEGMWSALDRC
jgi:hypothetical protein